MNWSPPDEWPRIRTIESHTGGEPLRVVVDGFPDLPGETILEKRRYAQLNHDDLRRAIMFEPRGHADMYGALLTDPVTDDGDIGVLFTHNAGHSTMCGHGVIALGVVLPTIGAIELDPAEPIIRMDTPAGRVTAYPRLGGDDLTDGNDPSNGDVPAISRVAFENVPAYAVALDETIETETFGTVRYDIGFGGAFYAYCDATDLGLSLEPESASALAAAGRELKAAIAEEAALEHPTDEDMEFLYGVIFTDEPEGDADIRNVCVFADGEVDRSPTGTGVSGHLALRQARGELARGESFAVESIVGSVFTGRVNDVREHHGREAVIPEIEGEAYITGTNTITVDPRDPFGEGFFIR
ncbi:proline racemase family protein [Halorubrum vacuolatum]|uniref:Proline racemase n=1 Tax=Halorubrum vacuolatum TaxID=63740 RepID=A0A238X1X1_HALVU|nr:proline racemase family protein [Halorubrum vacuolatum]SNR52946.1 proline racemase [Halorubrum vacuolatum]